MCKTARVDLVLSLSAITSASEFLYASNSSEILMVILFFYSLNATRQALEIAGAKNERRLFPVACTRLLG